MRLTVKYLNIMFDLYYKLFISGGKKENKTLRRGEIRTVSIQGFFLLLFWVADLNFELLGWLKNIIGCDIKMKRKYVHNSVLLDTAFSVDTDDEEILFFF